jgi:3-hydroxyacyl-[acyl-carrier-protein] dehydratase
LIAGSGRHLITIRPRLAAAPASSAAPPVKFNLIDQIIEQTPDRIVALKQVSLAEEYLADHFPGFPVLPGVMMVEAMVQAARALLANRGDERLVLGGVRNIRYGAMVRPGETLELEVTLTKTLDDGSFQCLGTGRIRRNRHSAAATGETAVSGRFTMRPIRTG